MLMPACEIVRFGLCFEVACLITTIVYGHHPEKASFQKILPKNVVVEGVVEVVVWRFPGY